MTLRFLENYLSNIKKIEIQALFQALAFLLLLQCCESVIMSFYSGLTHFDDLIYSREGLFCLAILEGSILALFFASPSTFLLIVSTVLLGFWFAQFIRHCSLARIVEAVDIAVGKSGRRILEAGTGSGHLALELAKKFKSISIVGVDYLADSLSLARRRAQQTGCDQRVHFEQCDLRYPSQGLCNFDLGVALDFIAYSQDVNYWTSVFKRIGDLLQGKAVFIADVPNRTFNRWTSYVGVVFLFIALALGWAGAEFSAVHVILLTSGFFLLFFNIVLGDTLAFIGCGRAQLTKSEIAELFQRAGFKNVEFVNAIPFLPCQLIVIAHKDPQPATHSVAQSSAITFPLKAAITSR